MGAAYIRISAQICDIIQYKSLNICLLHDPKILYNKTKSFAYKTLINQLLRI